MPERKIVIVGAGPVGSLAALYAAKRGDDVEIYELRSDLRHSETTPLNFTKSINLALSERGINAMRCSGYTEALDTILERTVPMHGRMIHTRSATGVPTSQSQAYDVHGRFQRSVDRGELNVCLLDELEKLPNVKFFFQHKLTGADFHSKKAWFEVRRKNDSASEKSDENSAASSTSRSPEIEVSFDFMIGSDGAHSAVRHHMMKYARMDYTQTYIDCLWCEFTMPPSADNDFLISPDHLHIWPGGSFMFIALPNIDKSFVCTLFGPVSLFTSLKKLPSSSELATTFERLFPGSTDLISAESIYQQFHQNPHLPLINIKCSPHHYSDSVVILGDAANAIVPFYGQGMNAGLESVRVLFETIAGHDDGDLASALQAYTTLRTKDTYAIADLALENYTEMRSSVVSPLYKMRKYVEERLDKYFPRLGWATQYSRVSFSNLRYSDVIKRAAHQKRMLTGIFASVLAVPGLGLALYLAMSVYRFGPGGRRFGLGK